MPGAPQPVLICGEVERPMTLTLAELEPLVDLELEADFHCHEGWSRLGEHWRGVRLGTLLERAGWRECARFVSVAAGEFRAVLTREQVEDQRVLLAVGHEGAVSPRPPGFPRLVGPSDWDCFLSVKSVELIEATVEPGRATAADIALGRIAR